MWMDFITYLALNSNYLGFWTVPESFIFQWWRLFLWSLLVSRDTLCKTKRFSILLLRSEKAYLHISTLLSVVAVADRGYLMKSTYKELFKATVRIWNVVCLCLFTPDITIIYEAWNNALDFLHFLCSCCKLNQEWFRGEWFQSNQT